MKMSITMYFRRTDDALRCNVKVQTQGVGVRLLIWNMLVIAFINGECTKDEKRLIKHVVRVTKMDKSVFLEMEQLMKNCFISR